MKRFIALTLLLLFAIVAFCGCGDDTHYIQGDGFNKPTTSPYQSDFLPEVTNVNYRVYVCGAVQTEGYFVVKQGTTIAEVIAFAGILPQTVLPQNAQSFVQTDCQIMVDYHQNGVNYSVINVNGLVVISNAQAQNVDAEVIAKLHDYYTQHGTITNKNQLKQILTEQQYQKNHYKFFVQERDYATTD